MTVTGDDIVRVARRFKGNSEVPRGSNRGTFVEACQRATWLKGTGWPWCAAFVCYVAKVANVPLTHSNSAGAHDLANRHAANKVPASHVHPGMVVDYNIGSGHTGIVTAIDLNGGTVTSIDGNYGDKVTEHTMPLKLVRGFWAIPGVSYGDQMVRPRPKPKPLPAFHVTTSESGKVKVLYQTRSKKALTRWLMAHTLTKIAPNGITIQRGRTRK